VIGVFADNSKQSKTTMTQTLTGNNRHRCITSDTSRSLTWNYRLILFAHDKENNNTEIMFA
jgi:hypothetical protein